MVPPVRRLPSFRLPAFWYALPDHRHPLSRARHRSVPEPGHRTFDAVVHVFLYPVREAPLAVASLLAVVVHRKGGRATVRGGARRLRRGRGHRGDLTFLVDEPRYALPPPTDRCTEREFSSLSTILSSPPALSVRISHASSPPLRSNSKLRG